ncbi:MAG: hypothetical protein ACI85F_000841 [Bacteroidia bacterium]|jgi:hypothetical protein
MDMLLSQSIGLVMLYIIYRVALSRLTFFHLNRMVIMMGTGLMLALPLIREFIIGDSLVPVFGQAIQLPTIAVLDTSNLDNATRGGSRSTDSFIG